MAIDVFAQRGKVKYTIFRVSHGGTSCCEQTWQIRNFSKFLFKKMDAAKSV